MGIFDIFPPEWLAIAEAPVTIALEILLVIAAFTAAWKLKRAISEGKCRRTFLARLQTAMDREAVAKGRRSELEKQIEELKAKIAAGAEKEELSATSARLDAALAEFQSADGAVYDVLSASVNEVRADDESPSLGRTTAELQQDAARLDVELKRLELKQKSQPRYGLIWNPIVITAIISVVVTFATGLSSYIVAYQQRKADENRHAQEQAADKIRSTQETKKALLLGSLSPSDPHSIATKLKLFLDTKLTEDPDIREAEQELERQLPRSILLNILRASAYEPLEFSSSAAQNSYSDLLEPIGLHELNYFIRGGYPRELLLRLFIDYVSLKAPSISDPQGRSGAIIYNDPGVIRCLPLSIPLLNRLYPNEQLDSDQRQICFNDLVDFALLSGLSSEIRAVSAPSASGDTKQTAAAGAPAKGPGSSPSSTPSSNPPKPFSEARLCFDGPLANLAMLEYARVHLDDPKTMPFLSAVRAAEYQPVCGGMWPPTSAGTNTISVYLKMPTGRPIWDIHLYSHDVVEIGTRSTIAIYNFLGRLLRAPESEANLLVGKQDKLDRKVLTITKGQTSGCFAFASLEGEPYCVPTAGTENTKRVFSLLSQLPQ